jgi:hypothetical protein
MKKIIPVIKRTRVSTVRYEVCPHCSQEIHEKEHFVDDENYVYHSACIEKGPIDIIKPIPFLWPKRTEASGLPARKTMGTLEKNVAGKDYKIEWSAFLDPTDPNGQKDSVDVTKPVDMPDDLWFQIIQVVREEAKKQARSRFSTQSIGKAANWLAMAELEKTAEIDKEADKDLVQIAIPLTNHNEIAMFESLVRMGVANYHEAFTGEPKAILDIHKAELPGFVAKLRQIGTSMANVFADKVERMPQYPGVANPHRQTRLDIIPDELTAKTKVTLVKLANGKTVLKGSKKDVDEVLKKMGQFSDADVIDEEDDDETPSMGEAKIAATIPMNKPIDEALLSDGLGAFLDTFVNYHSGKEGGKIAKWMIAICEDPKFAKIAPLIQKFHELPSQIYRGILEIAKEDSETGEKVATALKKIKTAQVQPTWTKERWEETCGYGEDERYLVNAIRNHLLTEEQRQQLFQRNISIEDILNGRVQGEDSEEFSNRLFSDWNAKLGWREFGF